MYSKIAAFFVSVLATLAAGLLIMYISYSTIITLHPALTHDGKHPVMPIGQLFIAFVVTLVICPFVFILIYKKIKRRSE